MYVNQVNLIGNLGADVEIRTTQKGAQMAILSLFVEDFVGKDKSKTTNWFRIVLLSSSFINSTKDYLKKGRKIYVREIRVIQIQSKEG